MKERTTPSHAVRDDIIKLWNSGLMIGQIIEKLPSTNYHMVRKFLKDAGIYQIRKHPLINVMAIIDSYTEGFSVKNCSDKYKLSISTITKILRDNGVVISQNSNKSLMKFIKCHKITKEFLSKRISGGMINPLCKELNTNHARIYKLLDYFDIPFTPRTNIVDGISEKELNNILYLREIGWTGNDIGREYGYSKHTMWSIFQKHKPEIIGSKSPITPNMRKDFLTYAKKVRKLTEQNLNLHGLKKVSGFHWNHRLSILDGWRNRIPFDFIANVVNLELITAEENLSIKWVSKISVNDLKKEILEKL